MSIEDVHADVASMMLADAMQSLLQDVKKTQCGDQKNMFFATARSTNTEPSLYRNIKFRALFLEVAAKQLGPAYTAILRNHQQDIAVAALFLDLQNVFKEKTHALLSQYNIQISDRIVELSCSTSAAHRKECVILKTANSLVSKLSTEDAANLNRLKRLADEELPLLPFWEIEGVAWKGVAPVVRQRDAEGSSFVVVMLSASAYAGNFRSAMHEHCRRTPGYAKKILEFIQDAVFEYLNEQSYPAEPDAGGFDVSLKINLNQAFDVKPSNTLLFEIPVIVEWEREYSDKDEF